MKKRFAAAALALAVCCIHIYDLLYPALVVIFSVAGVYYGAATALTSSPKYTPPGRRPHSAPTEFFIKLANKRRRFRNCNRKTVTTKNLDVAIQSLFDLIAQDYVKPWYKDIGIDSDVFIHLLQDDLWLVMAKFSHRLQNIPWLSFIARDIVNALTRHFHEVKLANKKPSRQNTGSQFILHSWLASPEKEEDFLRQLTDVFLIYLLPESYARSDEVRTLFREILTCSVFAPGIDIICDPDYLNQKIVEWLDYKEQLASDQTKTFTYAATYEEFMKMIELSQDIDHLQSLRYSIMSEIMQATTIQNLKRAKGLDTDKDTSPRGTTKGDLLRARNLKRYLNQLSITKGYCEKRIHFLGGPDYHADIDSERDLNSIPGRKILSFQVIMDTPEARQFLMKYLHRLDEDSLLGFWTAIENMKLANKRSWHHMATEIFQMFVIPSVSHVKGHLKKSSIKNMEAFMIGDTGPDAFWCAQKEISTVIEESHYPSFILSDIYHSFILNYDEDGGNVTPRAPSTPGVSPIRNHPFSETSTMRTRRITLHSNYAQEKLHLLDEKITNKTQALKALKSQKNDPKIQRVQDEIERETTVYQAERKELVAHIERTDLWAVNLGRWKAVIHKSEVTAEDEGREPSFLIVVHLPEVLPTPSLDIAHGWTAIRKLEDFKALHKELSMIKPELKKRSLPRMQKFRRKALNSEMLGKMASSLQDFLDVVLSDEHLSQSEAVFAFFSPSPEHLKISSEPIKNKDKVSFPNLFTNLSLKSHDSDSEDDVLFSESESEKDDHSCDWVAEPLYMFIGEVFELRGVFKWLRRSLIAFVQVTFGRSINRQVKETVDWILSEQMLIYYLNSFRDAYWPDGKLADRAPVRSDEEKLRMRLIAKEKFLRYTTDTVKNLVGEANAKNGAIKVFEYLQDVNLNKHLFYILLQAFVFEAFPELRHFQNLEKEEERKRRERDSSNAESSDDESERCEVKHKSSSDSKRQQTSVSKMHNSNVFWLRI